MLTIHDLHLQTEILPLFDHVSTEFSRDALLEIMTTRPASIAEITTRQTILAELIRNQQLIRPFTYPRAEFHEARKYLQDLPGRKELPLFGARARRSREIGQLSNLFIFFHQLDQAWFQFIDPRDFPEEFQKRLTNIREFFSDLEVSTHYHIVRNRNHPFTQMECSILMRHLLVKTGEGKVVMFWNDLFYFEGYLSIAKGIAKHRFTFPIFTGVGLAIKGFYHPLIKNPVRNDINTGKSNVTLITGPNMSGKSTLLKSIGLCVTLAHLGLAVPAEKCELPFYDVIAVAINLNDDIGSGYSHFMTEIVQLKDVVVEARNAKRCFAIFDELFRGTNVEDALAISRQTIDGLTQFAASCFFISTHLHQLKDAVASHPNIRTQFIDCRLVDNKPVFTYTLREGWSDLRIGQILFDQLGLKTLLDRTPPDRIPPETTVPDRTPLPNTTPDRTLTVSKTDNSADQNRRTP